MSDRMVLSLLGDGSYRDCLSLVDITNRQFYRLCVHDWRRGAFFTGTRFLAQGVIL